jgi:two-component system chemotaxis response regulator CheB
MTFNAIEAGAVTALAKPPGPGHPIYHKAADNLIRTVKLMSEIKIISRKGKGSRGSDMAMAPSPPLPKAGPAPIELVVIGASTGGPPALKALLTVLPPSFPAPIVIVQHIADGFLEGFAAWLAAEIRLKIMVAAHQQPLEAATVYLIPNGTQAGVDHARILLDSDAPNVNGLKPSVSCLFRSAAINYGNRAIGILLTGMGSDGAAELKRMRDQGAVTFAQDMASSVVHGMPGAAIKLGAASHILPPDQIGRSLVTMTERG